jgi:ABC-type transport system involved in cytochrome c biogenesis permease component
MNKNKIVTAIIAASIAASPIPLLMILFAAVCFMQPSGSAAGFHWLTLALCTYVVSFVMTYFFFFDGK